jgi:hypothetical protein
MISSTERRLAMASAIVATMAVAIVPAATFAVSGETGFIVDGKNLTAAVINPTTPVTGTIDASIGGVGSTV